MSAATLVVPVFLDGLCLAHGQPTGGPLLDPRNLPFVGRDDHGPADMHSDTPWLGASVSRPALAGTDAWLPAGVHLHWALPDALAHARRRGDDPTDIAFRPAPDRWLVTRRRGQLRERRWLVESNYLWPHDQTWTPAQLQRGQGPDGLAPYLLPAALRREGTPPWRYLGRCLDLDADERPGDPADPERYLERLTAVGPGDPHFAAHYPSCRGVFGLHDPDVRAPDPDLTYEILGWFSRPADDPLTASPAAPTDLDAWLREALGWRAAAAGNARRVVCHARITAGGLATALDAAPTGVTVAVAENAVEALAALVADRLVTPDAPRDRGQVERFLEALLVADDLDHADLELDAPARAALHARGFVTTLGDPRWAVRPVAADAADAASRAARPTLPGDIAAQLHALDHAQRDLTRATTRLAAARHDLHTDWCRLLQIKYPPSDLADDWNDAIAGHDVDLVRRWLVSERLAPVTALTATVAAATAARDAARAAVHAALDLHNASPAAAAGPWQLVGVQGPRYHTPAPPAVALLGLPAGATDRHHADADADGTLLCAVVDLDLDRLTAADVDLGPVRSIARDADGPGLRTAPRPQPLFFEWQAELAALRPAPPPGASHDPDVIRQHFTLAEADTDLRRLRPGDSDAVASTCVRGRGAMSRGIQELVLARLEAWLRRRLDPPTADLRANIAALRAAFAASDPVQLALDAWLLLSDRPALTQSLAGLHESLQMLQPVAGLDIDDPLGFADERAFARDVVAPAVGPARTRAPLVTAEFSPLRLGDLGLTALHLVDTWGRPTALPVDAVRTSQRLASGDPARPVALPARIAQPCRLSLRWLDAVHTAEEADSHPASSPICGWLVPDTLDGSVQVFDADGVARGSVDADAVWRTAPGALGGAVRPADLADPHLARVVAWMVRRSPDEMGALLDTLESALENIAPPPTREQEARALLMGRPIAVVRMRTSLELQGPPATDQSLIAFSRTLSAWRHARAGAVDDAPAPAPPDPTRGFERVRFPLRIGEHLRLDDGVVGYWLERPADGEFDGDTLWAPQSRADFAPDDAIDVRTVGEDFVVWHSLADPPLTATVLMDPRAALHVTCGVVPAKSVQLPREPVERALRAIGVTFPVAPVLALPDLLELPLADVPGWAWGFVARDGGRWQRIARDVTIARASITAAFPDAPTVWTDLHAAGWLAPWPGHDDHALVVPVTRRPALPEALLTRQRAVENVLDTAGRSLAPPASDARFTRALLLREGWLQLTRE